MMKNNNKKLNLIKDIGQIFKTRETIADDLIPESDLTGFMDYANVMMIIPKKKSIKDIIINLFEITEPKDFKSLNLDYKTEDNLKGLENKSIYSAEYLKVLLTIATNSERVTLKLKRDYPLFAETEDLILIIAPRVET